ncbi:hypothetical protein EYC84_009937 [Monilinia fructicola]|uniref:Uncharacterized protein n=1 Tax=Monilinia fructicola TaxID=38448 RepID=A0A5M9JB50_MONFR|nr:hypothetical protein EYC84_009937 [Monilinia fructicola]
MKAMLPSPTLAGFNGAWDALAEAPAGWKPPPVFRIVFAADEAHEFGHGVAVVPWWSEGVFADEPARRKDDEIGDGGTDVVRGSREDDRICMGSRGRAKPRRRMDLKLAIGILFENAQPGLGNRERLLESLNQWVPVLGVGNAPNTIPKCIPGRVRVEGRLGI